jgi:hypothetical protein
MLNDRLNAARKIAGELFPLERDLESTFLRATRLSAAIIEGRRDARMAITAGQESLAELAAASALLIEARARIASVHAALADERLNAGLRTFAMGDVDECPPAPKGLHAVPDVRVA